MIKLFDKDGKEVEAFDTEELKQKNQEAIDAYKIEHPDKTGDLAVAEEKLKTKEKELENAIEAANKKDGDDNDDDDDAKKQQIDRLKKEKSDALESVNTVKEDLSKQISDLKTGMFETLKTKALDKLSGGDEEIKKKIEHEFDAYGESPVTEADTLQRLTNAATIVNGSKPQPNFMDNPTNISSDKGEGAKGGDAGNTEQESENSKSMRKEFDISDKDVEEFSGKE